MSSAAVVARQLRQGPPRFLGRRKRRGSNLASGDEEGSDTGDPPPRCTLRCVAQACRALGGGAFLFIVGTVMAVVGFYADPLSTRPVPGFPNRTEVDTTKRYHLHNLTYVGPVIMGLGGLVLVAGFVLTYDGKVVPAKPPHHQSTPATITDKKLSRELPTMVEGGLRPPPITIAPGRLYVSDKL